MTVLHVQMLFSAVPQPEVTPVLEDDGTVPLIDPNFFSISFLIVLDSDGRTCTGTYY